MFAARNGSPDVGELLLQKRANPNAIGTYSGGTILFRAITENNPEMVELLLKYKANPNLKEQIGKTALHHAIGKGARMVEIVLKYNPDLEAKTRDGRTAMDFALKKDNKKIIAMLEAAGA